ncbi:hypothetical protein [Streptomyces sp. PT12]|uniref:hypothetical protein n=1 Tax=Streptomyces sp. PT12 TaxID=1510197 RepID=UPI000DE4C549|nr:hypothetical protein [Streptomyces sp. PT12]RBM20481.1 hypothetical protein DEH69_08515 [Streptomyces sp. PT12]
MRLRGYRDGDRALLTGRWLPGELLGLPLPGWPALAEPTAVPPPSGPGDELCVAPGAFVRYADIDWVGRSARVETGRAPDAPTTAEALLEAAVAHGFHRLNLRRLYGWVTPAAPTPTTALTDAGFTREASVPEHLWLGGRAVEREIWGALRHD